MCRGAQYHVCNRGGALFLTPWMWGSRVTALIRCELNEVYKVGHPVMGSQPRAILPYVWTDTTHPLHWPGPVCGIT